MLMCNPSTVSNKCSSCSARSPHITDHYVNIFQSYENSRNCLAYSSLIVLFFVLFCFWHNFIEFQPILEKLNIQPKIQGTPMLISGALPIYRSLLSDALSPTASTFSNTNLCFYNPARLPATFCLGSPSLLQWPRNLLTESQSNFKGHLDFLSGITILYFLLFNV